MYSTGSEWSEYIIEFTKTGIYQSPIRTLAVVELHDFIIIV